jgi:FkbM family methyltransferase
MYIGGAGVARGYLGRPELTAERFIADPFSDDPSARLYRSGDLARHLSNGDIEYLGRVDDQIQIRGYRVELGEIQALLERHPAVEFATVVARDIAPGDMRLCAYLVPNRQKAATVRRFLQLEGRGELPGGSWYELPNGMAVVQLNKNETDFLYKEIFEEATYLRHGVTVSPGDCVFDVGANIGLFSLFIAGICPDVQIHAFEPLPSACELLRVNMELYGLNAKVFECGISGEVGSDTFVYYPNVSIFSGRFGDGGDVEKVVRSFLHNERNTQSAGSVGSNDALLDELLTERLKNEHITCALTTISRVIHEQGVEQIDLLKIDAEKSELDVLAGIEEKDWAKIRQMVIEVHDGDGRLEEVKGLLEQHGYGVAVEQDAALSGTGLYNLYAVRGAEESGPSARRDGERGEEAWGDVWTSPSRLVSDVRDMIKQRLPDHMVPSRFVLLEAIPLTPNGKVDRRALPDVNQQVEQQGQITPRTELEERIAKIWCDVLRIDTVGVRDNFFDLGGHSLLATQVISRLRRVSELDVPLRSLFEAPTVEGLASKMVQLQAEQEDEESLAQVLADVERL